MSFIDRFFGPAAQMQKLKALETRLDRAKAAEETLRLFIKTKHPEVDEAALRTFRSISSSLPPTETSRILRDSIDLNEHTNHNGVLSNPPTEVKLVALVRLVGELGIRDLEPLLADIAADSEYAGSRFYTRYPKLRLAALDLLGGWGHNSTFWRNILSDPTSCVASRALTYMVATRDQWERLADVLLTSPETRERLKGMNGQATHEYRGWLLGRIGSRQIRMTELAFVLEVVIDAITNQKQWDNLTNALQDSKNLRNIVAGMDESMVYPYLGWLLTQEGTKRLTDDIMAQRMASELYEGAFVCGHCEDRDKRQEARAMLAKHAEKSATVADTISARIDRMLTCFEYVENVEEQLWAIEVFRDLAISGFGRAGNALRTVLTEMQETLRECEEEGVENTPTQVARTALSHFEVDTTNKELVVIRETRTYSFESALALFEGKEERASCVVRISTPPSTPSSLVPFESEEAE